jgi:hypothetical protein
VTPSGIEPATFWFVAQCLNHYATACPLICTTTCSIINEHKQSVFQKQLFLTHCESFVFTKNVKSRGTYWWCFLIILVTVVMPNRLWKSSELLSQSIHSVILPSPWPLPLHVTHIEACGLHTASSLLVFMSGALFV